LTTTLGDSSKDVRFETIAAVLAAVRRLARRVSSADASLADAPDLKKRRKKRKNASRRKEKEEKEIPIDREVS
jgi:hypothetical protein